MLSLFAAVVYALFECSYELFAGFLYRHGGIRKNRMLDPFLFIGTLGLVVALTSWPLLALAHYAGWEKFALPPDAYTWTKLFLNASLDALFNVFLVVGVAFSSPILMRSGRLQVAQVVQVGRSCTAYVLTLSQRIS